MGLNRVRETPSRIHPALLYSPAIHRRVALSRDLTVPIFVRVTWAISS